MLPPEELKIKRFTKMFHGYNPEEVDDKIAFLMEQYTALYNENDELERKLRIAQAQLDAYQGGEETIREAVIQAQNTSEKMIKEAKARASSINAATKQTCERMINNTAREIADMYGTLNRLKSQVAAFRKLLLNQYASQIELVEGTAKSDRDTEITEFADEQIVKKIIASIKQDATNATASQE